MEVRASGKKKVHDGAKKKSKGKVLDSNFEGEDSRVLEHQEVTIYHNLILIILLFFLLFTM